MDVLDLYLPRMFNVAFEMLMLYQLRIWTSVIWTTDYLPLTRVFNKVIGY